MVSNYRSTAGVYTAAMSNPAGYSRPDPGTEDPAATWFRGLLVRTWLYGRWTNGIRIWLGYRSSTANKSYPV